MSAAAKKLLLNDPHELHTPDVLHSFGRIMRDLAVGVVHLCLAWRQSGKQNTYSHRIATQHRFRPNGCKALRTFPRVRTGLPKRTMLWCRFSVVSVSMVSFSSFSFNGFSLICFGFGSSALPAALPARLACLLGVCLLNLFAKTLFFEGGSWLSFGHAAGCGSRTTDVR